MRPLRFLSLFSGIEAASEAWVAPLGWECVGFAEIEPYPRELLRQRHPGVPNLGDVSKITEAQILMLGTIDLVVFGSPCQDLSVAGKRKGLDGARSGLFFDAMRIVGWAREWCGLRFALWENVPGAFTSNKGADFAAVVDHMAGLDGTTAPEKGWGTEGCAVGEAAMVEWATLDAQWFGVAQRRRRVFALADFGDWAGRPPILLEPEGMRGDSPPSRSTGEEVAGTLDARAAGGGFPGTDGACNGHVVAQRRPVLTHEVVSSLDASFDRLQGCSGQDANHGHSHLVVQAFGGNNTAGAIDVTPALLAQPGSGYKGDFESETFIAYMPTRRYAADGEIEEIFAARPISDALHTSSGNGNKAPIVLAFNSNAQPDQQVFDEHVTAPLTASQYAAVAYGVDAYNGALVGMKVRRLTPRECERLQDFPDDYTLITKGKRNVADGPRYKALGNSMCRSVMQWVGHQIDFAWRFF